MVQTFDIIHSKIEVNENCLKISLNVHICVVRFKKGHNFKLYEISQEMGVYVLHEKELNLVGGGMPYQNGDQAIYDATNCSQIRTFCLKTPLNLSDFWLKRIYF